MLGRVDYQISQKQSIFGRYMATTFYQPSAYGISKNILASTQGGLDDLANSATLGHTYLFSPNVVNQFRFAFNRVGVHRFNDDYFSGCDLGISMTCYIPHQTVVAVTGGPGIGIGTAIQASFIPTIFSGSDDVTWIRGAHQFAFGFSMFHYVSSSNANVYSVGHLHIQRNGHRLGPVRFGLGPTRQLPARRSRTRCSSTNGMPGSTARTPGKCLAG